MDQTERALRYWFATEILPALAPAPTIEERYGPWVCMGCGKPHKLGEPCPVKVNLVIHVREMRRYPDAIYIGRPMPSKGLAGSIFANPYKIDKHATREEVIAQYRVLMSRRLDLFPNTWRPRLLELKDHPLACWCAPEACHGDVLAELVARITGEP